jgi:hypothetical protein
MIDFLTHPHHRHTQTFEWLKEAIGSPVRTLYGDPETLRAYLPSLQTNPPKLLILFQLEHLAAWASCVCPVLVFPMNDLTRMTPDAYLASLRNVEWISFSRALHQRLAGLGLSSRYLQYAPDPEAFPEVSWEHGPRAYFWERLSEDLSVQAAGEILRSLDVENLEVRQTKDPLLSSGEQVQSKYRVKGWQPREEYLRSLAGFNLYVASRRHEGIGMAFLEAMAMGMCVVAENQPTANEYILAGRNGILYAGDRERIYSPRRVASAELARMGREARETIRRIHGEWITKKVEIGQCVEAMLQRRLEPKAPPAGLLNLTIDFWEDQKGFWESFGSGDSGIWRSGAIKEKGRRARSVGGRIRTLWRHLKDAARRANEAVGSDG